MNEKTKWIPLPGAGSDRHYSRGIIDEGSESLIRVYSPDINENKTFIDLARVFSSKGLPVPQIYDVNESGDTYYIEDFGSQDLFSFIGSTEFELIAEKALKELVRLQTLPENLWISKVMHPSFSVRQAMYDLNYFKYCFLKPSGAAFDEELLEDDLQSLAHRLTEVPQDGSGFMYRDFQSRNIMVKDGEPKFIDFQGGRKGPVLYDVVSFLWQAKASLPDEIKMLLLDKYANEYEKITGVKSDKLLERYPDLVLFRTLQVLGAYGMRGLTQRRSHFLQSIPCALRNLNDLIERGWMNEYPELRKACISLCDLKRFDIADSANGKLRVQIYSFSYKKGYPDDFSGNGGGFMFDCRAMHNPGRYEEYKTLTGQDVPVIKFLEERGEVQVFLSDVRKLVFPAIDRYIKRGFTSLQIGFGCTGGRHRSVYCADRLAESVKEHFPEVEVELIHREQGISRIL